MRVADIEFINTENADVTGIGKELVKNDTLVFFNLHGLRKEELEEILKYKSFTHTSWKKGKTTEYFVYKYGWGKDSHVIWCYAGFSPILIRYLQNHYGYVINGKELYRAKEITALPQMKFQLWDFQKDAVEAWINSGCYGILKCPTAAGKTIIGCSIIKKMNTRTIILVHTSDLLINVWFNYLIEQFGEEIKDRIGLIGGNLSNKDRKLMRIAGNDFQENIKKDIVIATSQSLLHGNKLSELGKQHFGLCIFDEIHHYPSEQFKRVVCAIRAAYRLGLSVSGDTYIQIITSKNKNKTNSLGNVSLLKWLECKEETENLYEIIRIDELYNRYNKNNDKEIIDINKYNVKTYSFDGKKISESKITDVHRYKCTKNVYKIITESGREIKVTEDHSLFKLDNEYNIVDIKTSDLKIGDHLTIPKRINNNLNNSTMEHLNVFKQLGGYKNINQSTDSGYSSTYVGNLDSETFNTINMEELIPHMLNKHESLRKYKNKIEDSWKYKYDFKNNILPRWKNNKVIPIEIFYDLQINNPNLKVNDFMYIGDFDGSIKLNVDIHGDKYNDLIYILGFFSADGWINKFNENIRGIGFSCGYHEIIINKVISKLNNITNSNEKVKINKIPNSSNIELIIHSVTLAKLFESLGVYENDIEDKEPVKNVPSIIFDSSIETKKKFIEGLIDGDGHLGNKNIIHITNTSKKLIYGLMSLINSIGYVCNIDKKQPVTGGTVNGRTIVGKRESYSLYFDNRLCNNIYDNMNETKKIMDVENDNVKNDNHNYLKEEQKITMLPLMNSLKNLILKISRTSSKNCEIQLNTSRQSLIKKERLAYDELDVILIRLTSLMLIKNDFRDYLLKMYKSDICFDKIKKIELIKENIEYVYDISVNVNTQNFIGNSIICHNSATLHRSDGLSPIFHALLGDVRYHIEIKKLVKKGLLVEPIFFSIIIDDEIACHKIKTCKYKLLDYSRYVKKVSGSSELKFKYILGLCESLKSKNRKFMLYTDFVNKNTNTDEDGTFTTSDENVFIRDDYVNALKEMRINVVGIKAEMSGLERQFQFNRLGNNEIDGLVFGSTGNEGINIPSVDAIIMVNATASTIRFPQRVGRGMRTYKNKKNCYVYEILLNVKKELQWSKDNFLEYDQQGFIKENIYVNNDGYQIKKI